MLDGNLFQGKRDRQKGDILFDNGTLRVILIGCLAIAVSLFIMSLSSILITRNVVVENLKKVVIQHMAGSISAGIDGRIERAVDASLILSSDDNLIKWIESREKDEAAGAIAKGKMLELVRDLGYDTTFVTSALSGNYWSCEDEQGAKLLYQVSEEDENDSWFYYILNLGRRYEININYDKKLKDTFVWIDSLVGEINKPIAVTGVGMNLSKVIKDLAASDLESGLKNEIWLVDDKGDIYLSKNQDYMDKNLSLFLPEELENSILNSDELSRTFFSAEYKDHTGELYDIAYRKIKNTKWNLIIQIPRNESMSFLNRVVYNTLIACVFVIVIVIIMFNTLSRRIADPYKRALLINEELENKISARTKELNEQHAKIMDSIEYAKLIQKTILPTDEELQRIFRQYFIIWEPRDIVGGDFYWIRKFEDGTLVVLGDCTGHGVPGALMTMAVNSILNHIVGGICHNDPALILEEMDKLLKQDLRRDQNEESIHDGLDAGILFIANNSSVLYSGAQIPLWVSNADGVIQIRGDRHSIGSDRINKEKKFTNEKIEYSEGMTLYMATDGLKDQLGGMYKLPFGKSRVLSLLSSINNMSMEEQRKELWAAYTAYTQDEIRRDDVAMIGIRI